MASSRHTSCSNIAPFPSSRHPLDALLVVAARSSCTLTTPAHLQNPISDSLRWALALYQLEAAVKSSCCATVPAWKVKRLAKLAVHLPPRAAPSKSSPLPLSL